MPSRAPPWVCLQGSGACLPERPQQDTATLVRPRGASLESLNGRCAEGGKTNIGRRVEASFENYFQISRLVTG